MKWFFGTLVLIASVSVLSMTSLAQLPLPPPHNESPAHVGGFSDRWDRGWRPRPTHREPRVIKEGLLAPPLADRMAFTNFLRNKNTGLIRLMAREVYDSGSYRVKQKLNLPGGGAYYSFANLTHAYGYGSDIELDRGALSVGFGGMDYGMLANLGETPLEQMTLDDMRLQHIAMYRPPRSPTEAREERRRLDSGEGMTFAGLLFQKTVPVRENSTYLLRSIAYNTSDVLVGFKLIRHDADGSVIIAWRLLKRYSTPKFKLKHRSYLPAARTMPLPTRR